MEVLTKSDIQILKHLHSEGAFLLQKQGDEVMTKGQRHAE